MKKDLAAARDLYLAAADKGNGKAMHNLAVLYAEGINGPADYSNAAHWFREAADHGITDSQYNLGILYARGIGVEQNYAESYKWFALAANQGDKDAAKKRDEVASHLDQQSLAAAQPAVQTWTPSRSPTTRSTSKRRRRLGSAAQATRRSRNRARRRQRRHGDQVRLKHVRSIRQAARGGDGVEAPFAQHVRGERQRAEQRAMARSRTLRPPA